MAPVYPRDVPPTAPNRPPVAYQVTGQTRTFGLGASGQPTPGYEVQFTTAGGMPGAVFIPDGRYNVANVQAAITDLVRHIDGVQALKG